MNDLKFSPALMKCAGYASSPVPGDAAPLVPGDVVPRDTPLAVDNAQSPRPLSINLAKVRRALGLTVAEFSRPFIEDGGALITRLETGFSKPAVEVLQLIREAWGISRSFLLTGQGEMFTSSNDYCAGRVRLLRKYLAVATFDRQGRQYWKRSLVDDLGRLIDVAKLNGAEMCRVEQFEALLERMGR